MSRKNKQGALSVSVKKIPTLSNGMKSTNGNWREFARLAFGDESAAVKYMDHRIGLTSENNTVRETEPVMRLLLATINDHPESIDKMGK